MTDGPLDEARVVAPDLSRDDGGEPSVRPTR
jgi:hypothetical protein